jgi:hypothetical protein
MIDINYREKNHTKYNTESMKTFMTGVLVIHINKSDLEQIVLLDFIHCLVSQKKLRN